MESEGLHLNIDYLGSSGIMLSPEQKASLQTSLCILKNNQKFSKVYFWGKILGVKDDYFIAQGSNDNEIGEKRTLYSKDCVHWGLLPPPSDDVKSKAAMIKGRFTGDPSYEFEHQEMKRGGAEEAEEEPEPEVITLKEEDRLAAVIADIDHDCRIVPRGAYVKTPTGKVYQNRSFEGLSTAEAAKLGSFMHFRDPDRMLLKSLLQKASMDKAIDFMDTSDEDVPKGSWSLQFERGSALVILRNLLWPGYTFYHVPGSRQYGAIYAGNGEKNLDLPFML